MKLHELPSTRDSRKKGTRVGRGPGSGSGKTSGRGHKGQGQRKSGNVPAGFEGGQMPLHRRLPKRGFKNPFRKHYTIVNLEKLSSFKTGDTIDAKVLIEASIIGNIAKEGIKVLANGEINQALTVKAQAFSDSAAQKIEKAGGKAEVLPR